MVGLISMKCFVYIGWISEDGNVYFRVSKLAGKFASALIVVLTVNQK